MSEFEQLLDKVVTARVPGCQGLVSAERLSGGASQETYRLIVRTPSGEQRLALRRAPGGLHVEPAAGHPGLKVEAMLMQAAAQAGVPEPEVMWVLEPGDGLGDGFLMQWLDGEALGARIVRAPELARAREQLAFECGQILARIHQIDLEATGLGRQLEVVQPEAFVRQTWERYQAFDTPAPMIDYTARWLLDHLPEEPGTCLVHNDFRNGNIMVDKDGVVAVLDWEVAHIGDPMRDLGWICTNSWRFGRSDLPVGGFGDYADLFAGYESITGTPVDAARVKFWEVFGSFWWAVGCLGMAEHYRTGPDKTVERPAIGRRSSECQVDCVNLLIPGAVALAEPGDAGAPVDMPTTEELLVSVRDFLRGDVMSATQGRTNFLARVAANSLDIVLRERDIGPRARRIQRERLCAYYGESPASDVTLAELSWRLVHGLRDGRVALDDAQVVEYLREAVVNQVAVDQPRYSGYRTAIANSAAPAAPGTTREQEA